MLPALQKQCERKILSRLQRFPYLRVVRLHPAVFRRDWDIRDDLHRLDAAVFLDAERKQVCLEFRLAGLLHGAEKAVL